MRRQVNTNYPNRDKKKKEKEAGPNVPDLWGNIKLPNVGVTAAPEGVEREDGSRENEEDTMVNSLLKLRRIPHRSRKLREAQ